MAEIRWSPYFCQNWFRSNSNSSTAVILAIIHNLFKWVIMVIRLSFHWDSWLSETVKNCFLSHLIPSSLERHHDFENWYSGQLFILIYCSDCFANNKRSVFSLQWPARWIKGENISFNSRNFGGTKLREVADSQNLWDLLSRMVRLIFANDQMRRNSRDNFLRITNFKKYKTYFLWKEIFLEIKRR